MSHRWTFGDLEFVVLWDSVEEDFLPRPLVFTSRTPLHEDYLRERAELHRRLQATTDPEVYEVLDVVARPDIRLVVRGVDAADQQNPKRSIRLLAARRGDRGYLLTQIPGETVNHSGGYTIAECDALDLAQVVVDQLPEQPAGDSARIALPTAADGDGAVDHSFGRSDLWDSFEDPSHHAADKFLQAPLDAIGRIEIAQGVSTFGPRGRKVRQVEWRDLLDDGRYLISGEKSPVAIGVDDKKMVSLINNEIAIVVRAIRDQRL